MKQMIAKQENLGIRAETGPACQGSDQGSAVN